MKPADFPLGSCQSRAAARLLLAQRQSSEERREVILGCDYLTAAKATEWVKGDKGRGVGRIVSVPAGMTIAEGLRVLGGYSTDELERIAEANSEPVHSCSIYTLRRY
jgi:hypothetical protein